MLELNERYVEIPSELPKRMRGVFKMRTCAKASFQYLGKATLTLLLSAGSLHTGIFSLPNIALHASYPAAEQAAETIS